ncbi:MAG: hypothetical protein JJU03_09085 [Idiomarina sp.]|nr:hypothetical protein [Idiomarina sp.]
MTSAPARKGSPRTKWYILLFILIVAVVAFYVTNDEVAQLEAEQSTADNQTLQNAIPAPGTGTVDESPSDPENFSFAYCEGLLTDTHSDSINWGRANYKNWVRYLDEGYSLDEVTLAVDHFTNSNFAGSFRAKLLRRNTEVSQTILQLEEEVAQQFPEVRDSGFRLAPRIPALPLEGFVDKSPDERGALLQEHGATVDDVAYFLTRDELTEDDLMLLLEHVTDPFALVNYDRLETVSLLNYAIANTRPRIVEALLHAGIRPAEDNYLGSSMEWALSGLNHRGERQERAALIVSMLLPFNAAARFDVQNQRQVTANFPRNAYRFNEDRINAIRQDYGIDLTQIPSRQVPSIASDHRLIQELEAERVAYINAETVAHHLDTDLVACEQLVEAVNEQWQPRQMHQVLNSVIAEYPDAPERIKSELAQIDPSLVDVFRERHEGRQQRFDPVDMPQEIHDFLHQGQIENVIAFYSGKALSDANVNSLMWNIFGWDVSHYEAMRHSGLLKEPLEYFDMQFHGRLLRSEAIQQLEDAGADMRGSDSRQKTVLFYAVKRANTELVTFLEQRGYPFSFDDLGQDPLHAALDTTNFRLSMDVVEELVPTLMEYRPVIDEFHLSRMAVIQLKYPQTYRALVSQYPELEAPPGTELPPVR